MARDVAIGGGGGGGCNTPNNSNVRKVGQNGTDICVKLKVKLGIKRMTEVAQSYEIVRNSNNFKAFVMFAVKKFETMLMLVRKIFLTSLISGCVCRQTMTTPPPPPMLVASRRPWLWLHK
jgi:hypothetical protein